MKTINQWVFSILFILLSFGAFAEDNTVQPASRVAMVLSTDNPQVTGMALHMAWGMTRMAGADVTVILGAASLQFALKAGQSPMFPPKKKTIRALIKELVAQGSKIYVCSMCAFAQKIKQEDLLEGVNIETGMTIMPLLADPKVKVISF